MVKIRNDRNALERLVAAIPAWLNTRKGAIPENAQAACLLAIQIATGKPIPAQLPRLKPSSSSIPRAANAAHPMCANTNFDCAMPRKRC
ncbi:hypothetical protein PCI56_26895 [Plesiomonas shigelloides subsp. oncorhynchi]|nr:hypothetical protein [Plesiomonas shigelloides]